MSLGRREARHQTMAAARTAGVNPEDYWTFKPGQKVMTADGFAGVVAAVDDGPVGGAETYEVTLDNGMGGGQYTASLLRAMPQKKSNVDVKTAADDYPELGSILEDRPPLALSIASSLQTEARDTEDELARGENPCTTCGGSGKLDGEECDQCDGSGDEPNRRRASLVTEAAFENSIATPTHRQDESFEVPESSHEAHQYVQGFMEGHSGGVHGETRDRMESAGPATAFEHGLVHGHNAAAGAQGLYQHLQRAVTNTGNQSGGENMSRWLTQHNHAAAGVGRTAAFNEGDPNKYTSEHSCPNCHSPRALESATGVIKCEDCGYEQDNPGDGYNKAASLNDVKKRVDDFLDMHVRAPEPKKPTPDDLRNLSVDITGMWPRSTSEPKAKAKDVGRTASLETDDPWAMLVTAAADAEFRFHVTASYADVRNKAKRIRSEGKVNIISVQGGTVVANVKGDTAVYETEIVRMGSNAIAQWHCGCKWGAYAWGRQPAFKKFEGRLCSHALALHFEAQSQGMFGRQVTEEEKAPGWLKPRTRVVVDFDRDDRKNVSRPAQPRKRDLMRTHAAVQVEESPLATLVSTALAEGVEQDEILVSLAAAQIDGRPFFTVAAKPEGYQTTKPGSHHKDRSGDLQPCARGGCGHPEGIHGEEGGHCDSPGCECSHYQGVGSPKEGSKKHHHEHHNTHVTINNWGSGHGGYFPLLGLGGWGGYGYGGYSNSGAPDGGDGDSDGDDGGSSDGGGSDGGGGTTASKHAFIDTMDPTYTPGNDVRPWPDAHGTWGATTKPDPSANPGSTGWASGGDPDEFKVDSSAFGREGSLWPRVALSPAPVIDLLEHAPGAIKSIPKARQVIEHAPSAFEDIIKGFHEPPKTAPRAQDVLPKPAEPKAPVKVPGAPVPHKPHRLDDNPVSKALNSVMLTDNAAQFIVDKAPGAAKSFYDGYSHVNKNVHDWGAKKIHDLNPFTHDAPKPQGDWGTSPQKPAPATGWGTAPTKPAPITPHAPNILDPHEHGAPKAFQAPVKPVPMVPGHGAPAMPDPHEHGAPQLQPQLQGQPKAGPRTTTLPPGSPSNAPNKTPQPADGSKGPNKSEPKSDDPGSRLPKPKLLLPPMPYTPDYYRSSNTNISEHGIGSRSSLAERVAALLAEEEALETHAALTPQQEFANGVAETYNSLGGNPPLSTYEAAAGTTEATLHDEPEAALPTTDGERDDVDDKDSEDMAVAASLESNAAIDDIVARFQATAGAAALVGGGSGSAASNNEGDVAAAAKAFLQTEAMKTFSPQEQKSIIDEGMDVTAANLDRLNIEGTHYEALEAALASVPDDDDLEF